MIDQSKLTPSELALMQGLEVAIRHDVPDDYVLEVPVHEVRDILSLVRRLAEK